MISIKKGIFGKNMRPQSTMAYKNRFLPLNQPQNVEWVVNQRTEYVNKLINRQIHVFVCTNLLCLCLIADDSKANILCDFSKANSQKFLCKLIYFI